MFGAILPHRRQNQKCILCCARRNKEEEERLVVCQAMLEGVEKGESVVRLCELVFSTGSPASGNGRLTKLNRRSKKT